MKVIDDIEQWNELSALFIKHGYQRWQWQYDVDCPEGLHVWF